MTTTTTMFVTRQQYDYLVTHFQNWMVLRWAEYSKSWGIGGCYVTAAPHAIENLQCQLAFKVE